MVEYGIIDSEQDYLIMSLHGNRVDFYRKYHGSKRDHNKAIDVGQQIIRCLQKVHSIGYVHCDIKPHNILCTESDEDQFEEAEGDELSPRYTLIDFGICSKYIDTFGHHLPKDKISKFRGSVEFCAADILAQFRK